jgi:hypothetical protein
VTWRLGDLDPLGPDPGDGCDRGLTPIRVVTGVRPGVEMRSRLKILRW